LLEKHIEDNPMRYARRSIHVSLIQVIGHIAALETNGDRKAAIEELITAAADGGIVAFGRSDEILDDQIWRSWWQDIRRGEGHIADDEREIIISKAIWNSLFQKDVSRTIRFYDVEFYRDDVLHLWPPKPKPKQTPSPEAPAGSPAAAESPPAALRRRAAYRNELRTFLALRDLNTLIRQGRDAIAAEFIEHCRKHKPELATTLPKPREVAMQVQKILDSRRAKPQQSSAGNRSQPPSSSHNRS
jgi:hypothetical protein